MKFAFASLPLPPQEVSKGTLMGDWMDWRWQIRTALKTHADFHLYFELSEQETLAFDDPQFQIRTTRYYAALAALGGPLDPIRRILMPSRLEHFSGAQSMLDPLGEKKNNPAPRIIHRYPDRLLFLVTDICSVYCRYCTRKHFTAGDQAFVRSADYQKALSYIRSRPGVREVILSGGDPLTLSDDILERVLFDLRAIEHIEIIRIGTRMPVVAPMRVTNELVQTLKKFHPVFIMTHFNHPRELTLEAAHALTRFVDHGFPVFNQMVLLNGVNNSAAIVQALSRRLLFLRTKPYYMFQCDPSLGTDHLRTSIPHSLEIQRELWGRLSGLAMPQLSVDIPEGGGKAGLVPNFTKEKSPEGWTFEGWDGVRADYVNPPASSMQKPIDEEVYLEEWNVLKSSRD